MQFKGQLHLHSTKSDGNATPSQVAEEYKKLGYDFIFFTDHGTSFDTSNISNEILCLPGSEWQCATDEDMFYTNSLGNKCVIHVNACGTTDIFDLPKGKTIAQGISIMAKEIIKNGAIPTVNHPNWNWPENGHAFGYRELLDIDEPYILEIGNMGNGCNNSGNDSIESVEYTWDVLLTKGKNIFVSMTDDAHEYRPEKRDLKIDTPGLGYVVIWADTLNEKNVMKALNCGNFYASNGLYLEEYEVTEKSIKIKTKDNGNNQIITFKGKMGIPLKTVYGTCAEYEFQGIPDEEYVRVKVIDSKFNTLYTQAVIKKL